MIVAGYILAALIIVGGLLYLQEMRHRRRQSTASDDDTTDISLQDNTVESDTPAAGPGSADGSSEPGDDECCGQHLVCEKFHPDNSRLYYEDEELDRYAGRRAAEYASGEIEEFRDVLLTLLPTDLPGWGQSLQQRGIELPAELRDEFLLMLSDTHKK